MLSVPEQIEILADSACKARDLVDHPLPALDDGMYLRPCTHGCTVISVDPERRPQQGILQRWTKADLQAWRDNLTAYLAERNGFPTRNTPEKALQSLLIRDAIRNHGRMDILSAACLEQPDLRFLTDELAISTETGKTVLDLLAVRLEGDFGVPVVIELKSDRRLKRLIEQTSQAAALIDNHRSAFERMAKAYWDKPVRLAAAAERWIIWPSAGDDRHGDLDPKDAACRSKQVRLVTYNGNAKTGFHLRAATRILP